ncbi:unnamed protein product [marine sediment metagenome]|uniref:Uncharacterized protein n=1 Tax=marine sediment metagenome TaxID=412755 RepID=X1R6A4_9ZZZZ
MKLAKERERKDESKLTNEIITESLDEKGRRKRVVLKDETLQPLIEWANEIGVSPEELVLMLVSCVRTLFDPNLSLADALRSIPSLAKDLGITKAKGKPPK